MTALHIWFLPWGPHALVWSLAIVGLLAFSLWRCEQPKGSGRLFSALEPQPSFASLPGGQKKEEEVMPVVLLWAVPTILVIGGVSYYFLRVVH